MKNGCALLAGGKGRRMGGVNKAELILGNSTFADKIEKEMQSTGLPCYLSSAVYEQKKPLGWILVKDTVTDEEGRYIGPMGGIYTCLKKAEDDGLDGLYFAPCDAPWYDKTIIEVLARELKERYDVNCACWRTCDGRVQTVFGWYSVNMLPLFEKSIRAGRFRLRDCLKESRALVLDTASFGVPENAFLNINTKQDYEEQKTLTAKAAGTVTLQH